MGEELAVHFNRDKRYPIKNTRLYPGKAIAKLYIEFYADPTTYEGTGFLADETVLYTNAHNVRDKNQGNIPARKVAVIFGLSENSTKSKVLSLIHI